MVIEILYISSFIVCFIGIIIISAMLSNSYLNKIQQKIDQLVERFNINEFKPKQVSFSYLIIKRITDLLFSIIISILLIPLFFIIAILIKTDTKGPVFVKLKKIGKKGISFYAYKFRTIYLLDNISSQKLITGENNIRVTKVGRFLRKTALDGLPGLFNVLNGTMSFVGITMIGEFEYEHISKEYKQVLKLCKPGLMNLWIVSGDRQKFKKNKLFLYNLYYLNNISFKLDITIIFKTIVMTLGITASY